MGPCAIVSRSTRHSGFACLVSSRGRRRNQSARWRREEEGRVRRRAGRRVLVNRAVWVFVLFLAKGPIACRKTRYRIDGWVSPRGAVVGAGARAKNAPRLEFPDVRQLHAVVIVPRHRLRCLGRHDHDVVIGNRGVRCAHHRCLFSPIRMLERTPVLARRA